jgi:hypothetical protein
MHDQMVHQYLEDRRQGDDQKCPGDPEQATKGEAGQDDDDRAHVDLNGADLRGATMANRRKFFELTGSLNGGLLEWLAVLRSDFVNLPQVATLG